MVMNSNNLDIKLFRKVFNNIILFRLIFNYVKLFRNEVIEFKNLKSLREYKERLFIRKIIFNSHESLKIGDLPFGGVLKEVVVKNNDVFISLNGNTIPIGVKKFYDFSKGVSPLISTLPSTIHTIKNVRLFIGSPDNIDRYSIERKTIPSNITSISFDKSFNISSGGFSIPNTIKKLKFGKLWNNDDIKLRVGDLPNSITKLKLGSYNFKNISDDVLPYSINHLEIVIDDSNEFDLIKYNDGLFNPITHPQSSIETLKIILKSMITSESNLYKCKSIKNLYIHFDNEIFGRITPSLLPNSLTKLSLSGVKKTTLNNTNENYCLLPDSIDTLKIQFEVYQDLPTTDVIKLPRSLTSLSINRYITSQNSFQFPPSLIDFRFGGYKVDYSFDSFISMLSILPPSITSITLQTNFKNYETYSYINFPKTIKFISYDDFKINN